MKKAYLALISLILAASFLSCGGAAYRDDVPVSVISSAVEAEIAHSSNLIDADADFISFYLEADTGKLSEYKVRIPSGSASIDEYGIFHVKDSADTADVKAQLEAYIESRKLTWDTRYDQSEADKVKSAKVSAAGNYLFYTILSAEEAEKVISVIEESLKAQP